MIGWDEESIWPHDSLRLFGFVVAVTVSSTLLKRPVTFHKDDPTSVRKAWSLKPRRSTSSTDMSCRSARFFTASQSEHSLELHQFEWSESNDILGKYYHCSQDAQGKDGEYLSTVPPYTSVISL